MKRATVTDWAWFLLAIVCGYGVFWICAQITIANQFGLILSSHAVPIVFGVLAFYVIARKRHVATLILPPALVILYGIATRGF